jgi:ABC-type Zn uptake system ZnuABC Zn-binding protein ZnuA
MKIVFIFCSLLVLAACAPAAAPTNTTAPAAPTVAAAQPAAISVPPTATALPPAATPKPRLKVVATTTQVTALTRIVGGDKLELHGILKADVDPHEYEPTADDVKAFANAQVIFINGVGLEKWLQKTIQNSGTTATVVDTSMGVKLRSEKDENGNTVDDPHIWHSPANAIIMLNNIRDGLSKLDAGNAETYKFKAADYEKKLNDLDAYIKAQIATIPSASRKVVTNHDAFGYYFERYGLALVGSVIPSMDTNFQPSAKELADLVARIKAQKVKAIFTESSINPQLSQQIAREAGVKVVDGALYGDTLGPTGSGADTLDGMLKANTDLIVTNLR